MKTLHNFNTWATFVPLYLVVWGYVADTVSPDQCRINYFFIQHVELCHKPNLKTADQCKKGWGFVLDELVIAPLTEYDDCGTFHNNDLLDANCLREKIVNYDERVFEVLGKVSGQNKIDNGTTVERFEFSVAGSDAVGGVGGGPAEKDTSAFVSFRRNCRPADPDMREDTVVNMCANMTIEDFRVYLTLQGTADIPSQASFCRCVITPNAEMDVKALDVRLQNVKDDGQRCGPSALKIESKESPDSGSRELKCEGKKALYGFHQLQKSSKDKEVVLTLTSVDSNHFPTAVWIEVEQEYDQDAAHTSMTVACEGFVPMSEQVVTDSESPDNSSDVAGIR
ncbi:hypothetical protein V1264_008523 [Littorina saxatilis]|uniref:Uncharacterized protein n=1 Tax=Littorina saxatilis TaxID=31220 RepID=A0AAN9G2D8_9CAEN